MNKIKYFIKYPIFAPGAVCYLVLLILVDLARIYPTNAFCIDLPSEKKKNDKLILV